MGSFFGEHGGIVREVELEVSAPELPRPATAGEVIAVVPETMLTVAASIRGARNGLGKWT